MSVTIHHAKIIDGFGELNNYSQYLEFQSFCGICDTPIEVSDTLQQYLLEERGLPVKFLRRGAIYCEACAERKGKINRLRKQNKWHELPDGREQLDALLAEARELERSCKQRYLQATWPYTTTS